MAVNIKCPNLGCRKLLKVSNDVRGKRVRCSYCGTVLLVPFIKPYIKSSNSPAPVRSEAPDQKGGISPAKQQKKKT